MPFPDSGLPAPPPSSPAPSLAICVPARNEAALLPCLLDSLDRQDGAGSFVLCLLLDGCSDDSAAIVAAYRGRARFPIVTGAAAVVAEPNAGRARRAAMALGQETVGDGGILLSTDADCVPAPDWVAANRAALAQADLVVGRIVRAGGRASPVQDRIEAYYDGLARLRRRLDPVAWESAEPHHYTSAASLACSATTYRALGGFEPVAAGEDARLVDMAHRRGVRVRRDGAVRVETSARRDGRAQGGLADHLRALDRTGDAAARMAHPEDVAWRYARHALARASWPTLERSAPALAEAVHRPVAELHRIARKVPNAEAFAIAVVPDVPGGERQVDLATAEAALAKLEADLRANPGIAA